MAKYLVNTPLKITPGKPAHDIGSIVTLDAEDGETAELLASGAISESHGEKASKTDKPEAKK